MKKQKPARRIHLIRPFRPVPLVITTRGPINAKEIEDFKRKWTELETGPAPLLIFCEGESAKVESLATLYGRKRPGHIHFLREYR